MRPRLVQLSAEIRTCLDFGQSIKDRLSKRFNFKQRLKFEQFGLDFGCFVLSEIQTNGPNQTFYVQFYT